jgi:hypothetical protein
MQFSNVEIYIPTDRRGLIDYERDVDSGLGVISWRNADNTFNHHSDKAEVFKSVDLQQHSQRNKLMDVIGMAIAEYFKLANRQAAYEVAGSLADSILKFANAPEPAPLADWELELLNSGSEE